MAFTGIPKPSPKGLWAFRKQNYNSLNHELDPTGGRYIYGRYTCDFDLYTDFPAYC